MDLVEAVAGFFSPRIRTREKRDLLMFSIYALISVLIIVLLRLVGVQLNTTLFRWDWTITVLLIIGAGGLFWLKSRFTRDKMKEAMI